MSFIGLIIHFSRLGLATLIFCAVLVASIPKSAVAVTEDFLQQCIEAVQGAGYRGGGMQVMCEGYFILPSNLLVRCINQLDENNRVADEKLAKVCQVHCESGIYFGPYPDYPGEQRFLDGAALFKQLQKEKRCSEL